MEVKSKGMERMLRAMEPTAFATLDKHKGGIKHPYTLTKIRNAEERINKTKVKLKAALKALNSIN